MPDGTGNVCELNGQTCDDPHPTTASKSDWTCTCPNGVQQAITSPVPECKVGKDECVEGPSAAVKECVHVPRYTEAGCLCECGWLAGGTLCEAGCCNPDQQADGDWCYVDKTDAYNQNKPQCLTRCTNECSAVTNSTKCAEAETCRWDAIEGCIPDRTPEPAGWTRKCPLYDDADQCKADPHCQWDAATNCTAVCGDFTEQKPCNATAECKWDESEKCVSTREPPAPRFVHKCVLQGDEASCTNDPHCVWENQRCKPSCWASMDEATCVQNELCVWGGGGEWGPDKCQTKRTPAPGYTLDCKKSMAEDACKQDPMCAWNTEKAACESTKCVQTTEATCNADRYCQWNAFESTCYLKCESLQGFPECNKAAHCMYDDNERCVAKGTPAPPGMECSMTKQSECNADPQCDWSEEKGKCFVMTCTGYTGEPRCTEDARCLWQGELSKCYWRCENVKLDTTCVNDARCTWSANETRCHVKQCPAFLSEDRCTANATDHCASDVPLGVRGGDAEDVVRPAGVLHVGRGGEVHRQEGRAALQPVPAAARQGDV